MQRRTKVLIVGNDWPVFLSHRLPLVTAIAAQGYDVHLALPRMRAQPQTIPANLTLHYIDIDRGGVNPFAELQTLISLVQLYRRVKPVLVHHFTIKPVLYGGVAARLAGIPAVINSMTGLGTVFASSTRSMTMLKRALVPVLRYACGGRHMITTFHNDSDRDRFVTLRICSRPSSVVIRGSGVDTDMFSPAPEEPGIPIVVLASRLLWDKGLLEFVEAARILRAMQVAARFVLVGGTDPNVTSVSEGQLRAWQEEGVVEWWGQSSNMPEIFRRTHIVCLPSYHEGLPRVLLEAASAGRPIVTTDIPGCRDIVRNEENGLVVPARDSASVAAAIGRLVEEPELRVQMGMKGRDIVKHEFALPIVTTAFAGLYSSVISSVTA